MWPQAETSNPGAEWCNAIEGTVATLPGPGKVIAPELLRGDGGAPPLADAACHRTRTRPWGGTAVAVNRAGGKDWRFRPPVPGDDQGLLFVRHFTAPGWPQSCEDVFVVHLRRVE